MLIFGKAHHFDLSLLLSILITATPSQSYTHSPSSPSPKQRATALDCPHFESCPGCITKHRFADTPIVHSAKLYFSSSAVQQKVIEPRENFFETYIPSPIKGWRTQAKLAVEPKSKWGNGCRFGLYERGSHKVIEIPDCSVHHPNINRAIAILSKATDKVKTPAWREETGGNGLRYVQLSLERMTDKVGVTLVWHADNLKSCQPGLGRLIKECKKMDKTLFHSFWCHTNDSLGNAIFARGERNWHPMNGPEFMRERIPGTKPDEKNGLLHFTPMTFRQGNMDGFEEIAVYVAENIPGNSRVCELYAGVGVLGLTALVYHANDDNPLQWLRCSDENPANPRCFKRAVNTIPSDIVGDERRKGARKSTTFKKRSRGDTIQKDKTLEEIMSDMMEKSSSHAASGNRKGKTSYMVASAATALHEGEALGAEVLIVDPPRKGIEDEVLNQLCKPHNPKQVYTEDKVLLQGPSYSTNWTNNVHTLIYVSCGFDALARDCDRLLKGNAGWKLASAKGFVLFPGSNHVETVAIFKRKAGRQQLYREEVL